MMITLQYVCCCSGAPGAAHSSQDRASQREHSAADVLPTAGVGPDQVAGPSCLPGLPGTSALKMLHSSSAPFQDEGARSRGYDHVATLHLLAAQVLIAGSACSCCSQQSVRRRPLLHAETRACCKSGTLVVERPSPAASYLLAIAWQGQCAQPAPLHPGQSWQLCMATAQGRAQ